MFIAGKYSNNTFLVSKYNNDMCANVSRYLLNVHPLFGQDRLQLLEILRLGGQVIKLVACLGICQLGFCCLCGLVQWSFSIFFVINMIMLFAIRTQLLSYANLVNHQSPHLVKYYFY